MEPTNKECGKCGGLKTQRPNGVWICKPCHSAANKKSDKKNAVAVAARKKQYALDHAEDIAAKHREYHKANAEKIRANVKAWIKANPEKRKAANRASQIRVGRETVNKYRKEHPEKRKQAEANYLKSDAFSITQRRHRHNSRAGEGSFTSEEWNQIVEAQDGKCIDCGEVVERLTVGHLVPVSLDGPNWPANIVGQCLACNSRQHNQIHSLAGKVDTIRSVALRAA